MFEAHKLAPLYLGLLALVFAAVLGIMVMYNRRSKARLKDLERAGHPAHGLEEGILLAQERTTTDNSHRAA